MMGLTPADAAARLHANEQTVRKWIRDGRLSATRAGGPRSPYQIAEVEIERFAATWTVQAAPVDEPLLTCTEVAGRLKTSDAVVRSRIRSGELRAVRVGGDRLGYRITEAELERFSQAGGAMARRASGHQMASATRAALEGELAVDPTVDVRWPLARRWLLTRLRDAGRSLRAVERAAGFTVDSLTHQVRNPNARLTEERARALAELWGDDPDDVASWWGYPDRRRIVARPAEFIPHGDQALAAWLAAAMEARNETKSGVAAAIGVMSSVVRSTLNGAHTTRPTLDKYAAHFGVDRFELRRLRPKDTGRAAAASWQRGLDAINGSLTPENAAERALKSVTTRMTALTPEERTGIAREALRTRYERRPPEGTDEPCVFRGVFCAADSPLVHRYPVHRRRGRMNYHRECYDRWQQLPAALRKGIVAEVLRQRPEAAAELVGIRVAVRASGDTALLAEIDEEIGAELRYLKDPHRGGPPKLLKNHALALRVVRLQHDEGLSAVDAARQVGMITEAPGRDPVANGTFYKLTRRGRAMLGYGKLPQGPRQRKVDA
jgi:excisionase family DNA binding protein